MKKRIKVLIVDDSATYRQLLHKVLISDSGIEVMGTAADPFIAASKMARQAPDVILLDQEMPRMSGMTFLKKIMSQHPVPVIFLDDGSMGTELAVRALEYGAAEVLSKKEIDAWYQQEGSLKICGIVKTAAQKKVTKRFFADASVVKPKLTADAVLQQTKVGVLATHEKVIAVGASTGGTEAIRMFLETLPITCPGVVIVQHMPENFTKLFADRLNNLCCIDVKEAEDGDWVMRGTALIAPGNKHMLLKRQGSKYYVELNEGPPVNRHRPSVDVLFRSVAMYAGHNSTGVLLTGMGNDGASGLLEIREAGGRTIAQDEYTSVVFGMPKEAIQLNAAEKILPIEDIAKHVMHASIH